MTSNQRNRLLFKKKYINSIRICILYKKINFATYLSIKTPFQFVLLLILSVFIKSFY